MQLSLMDSDESTSSPADFPARMSAQQESERASRALDPASGPRCSELSSQHDRLGSSLRMFLALGLSELTGCSLTWQKQATPRGRSWWVLSMPERRTDDNGCGLLPTPKAMDWNMGFSSQEMAAKENTRRKSSSLPATVMMLPTPRSSDGEHGGPNQRGSKGDMALPMAVMQMLPTPNVPNGGRIRRNQPQGSKRQLSLETAVTDPTGEAGPMRLNPSFVEAMMGYPPGWTEID